MDPDAGRRGLGLCAKLPPVRRQPRPAGTGAGDQRAYPRWPVTSRGAKPRSPPSEHTSELHPDLAGAAAVATRGGIAVRPSRRAEACYRRAALLRTGGPHARPEHQVKIARELFEQGETARGPAMSSTRTGAAARDRGPAAYRAARPDPQPGPHDRALPGPATAAAIERH